MGGFFLSLRVVGIQNRYWLRLRICKKKYEREREYYAVMVLRQKSETIPII